MILLVFVILIADNYGWLSLFRTRKQPNPLGEWCQTGQYGLAFVWNRRASLPIHIHGAENLRDLFCLLHDGTISHGSWEGSDLVLEVEIAYLAARVAPSFCKFYLRLVNVRHLRFTTWPNATASGPVVLSEMTQIFQPELQILEGNLQDGVIQVVCNQRSSAFDYSGGELFFMADGAQLTDEAGKYYAMETLGSLCKEYWDDWASGSRV